MRLLANTTSPYARIARVALAEKGVEYELRLLNPWEDDAEMLGLNPASRVPTLRLDSGLPLTESLVILLWLERKIPAPSLLGDGAGDDLDRIASQAGRAMGVVDAMVALVAGVAKTDPGFGETPVGLRRRRTILTGLRALDADPPRHGGGVPDAAVITAVVALDYLRLRFGDAPWVEPFPRLDALRGAVDARPSFATTRPYV